MESVLKRWVAVFVAAIALLAGGVTVALPASAAVYTCNDRLSGTYVPINFNASPDTACYLNASNYTVAGTRALQTSYNRCYADSFGYTLPNGDKYLATDGIYGGQTADAVRIVQDHHNLGQDGLYGPGTAAKFRSYVYDRPSTPECVHWNP